MLWKSVSALIVIFWLVMTSLLVKHSYFSDEALAKQVPVSTVLDRMARHQEAAGGSDTMQLLYQNEHAGDVAVGVVHRPAEAGKPSTGFSWHAGGRVTGKPLGLDIATAATWTFDADQTEAQSFERMHIGVVATHTKTAVSIDWKLGDEMPKIEVTREGELVMDTKAVMSEAKKQQGGGGLNLGGLTSMMPGFLGSQKLSLEHLVMMQAKDELIKVGDRRLRGSTITLSVFGLMQTKMRVTEGGEIAEIEMPNRWRALALLVLGLDPDVKMR